MTFKTLCEHIIQDGARKNEMCGCYVYKDDCIYCEEHVLKCNTCFENIIKYFKKSINRYNHLHSDICKLV